MLAGFADPFFASLTNWSPDSPYVVVSLVLGASSLLFNVQHMRKATTEGERRQQQALDDLRRRILDRVNDTTLRHSALSADSVRALAYAIEQESKSTVLTDKLISEAIRAAALSLEDHFKGSALMTRIEPLDQLLQALGDTGPRLMSLADVDRLGAYRKSQPIALALVLAGTLPALAFGPTTLLVVLSAVSLLAGFVLALSTVRAEQFWKEASGAPLPAPSWFTRLIRPKVPHRLLDFFLVASMSRERWAYVFWHLIWAPVWEGPLMLLRPWRFAFMHSFRYDAARSAACELREVQRQMDEWRASDRLGDPAALRGRFVSLCRRLWILTGDDYYKSAEREGELLSPPSYSFRMLALR